jgi:hypothetical protein
LSLQRNALDEISHKLALARKPCSAVCELLQATTELAELIEHVADHPTPAAASRIDLASMSVQTKLVALSVFYKEGAV